MELAFLKLASQTCCSRESPGDLFILKTLNQQLMWVLRCYIERAGDPFLNLTIHCNHSGQ